MTFSRSFAAFAIVLAGFVSAPVAAQTPSEIAAVQAYLTGLGYEPGPADGVMGERTRTSIEQFEASRGQPVTGASISMVSPLRQPNRVRPSPSPPMVWNCVAFR